MCEYCKKDAKELDCIKDLGDCSAVIDENYICFDCANDDKADSRYTYYGCGNIKINYCPICGSKL